jgi:hypothetical protein
MADRRRPGPPFTVDPGRLYEVGRDGVPRTDESEAMEWLGPRHRWLLTSVATASALIGVLAGLTVLSLALGARLWAAGLALATLAAAPLPLLGPGLDWWRHRRGRCGRHRSRPGRFPRA